MQNRIEEIFSYLKHGDLSLAIRRLLDVCLDTQNKQFIQQAIHFSKKYHAHIEKETSTIASNDLFEEANQILSQLQSFKQNNYVNTTVLANAENITKSYSNGNFSLQPITMQVKTGNIIGIVGENGNGKTTLLRCLAGQLSLNNGAITYSNLSNPDYYSIKHHVAFIPQRIPRWYGLLKDNLNFSASLSGLVNDENELMVDFMLQRLNLEKYANLTWDEISSGYRTRFEIARILLQKPTLLILDEPLANLDINAQQTILTDLRYMAKSVYHPMGIVLSSQQLHEVEKIADTVLFIKNGKCVYKTGDEANTTNAFILELETKANRETLLKILGEEKIQLQYNGGFYTITSTVFTAQQMLQQLINQEVEVSYYRDITHSTKRFF